MEGMEQKKTVRNEDKVLIHNEENDGDGNKILRWKWIKSLKKKLNFYHSHQSQNYYDYYNYYFFPTSLGNSWEFQLVFEFESTSRSNSN